MHVPPNIQHVVERPDRAIYFRVDPLPQDHSGLGLVLGGMGAVIAVFATFCTGSALFAAGALVSAAGGVALTAFIRLMNRPVPQGFVDARGFSWARSETDWEQVGGLRLEASPRNGATLWTAQGQRLVRWPSVAAESNLGWDLASVRWFAAQVADLAGVALSEDLGHEEAWRQRRETEASHRRTIEKLAALSPAEPEVIVEEDRIRIALDGSYATLTRQDLTWGERSELLSSITSVDVHFFEGRLLPSVQLRVHLKHLPPWILRDEHAKETRVPRLLGMRDALIAYVQRARPTHQDQGTAADVPQALRGLRKE